MKYKGIILLIIAFSLSASIFAQKQNDAKSVLDKYGMQKGSVLVQLSKDVLSQGSNLTLYKSLMLEKTDAQHVDEVLNAFCPLTKAWTMMSEVKREGRISSGTYFLELEKEKNYQYLLIKNTNKQLTIIYIEGPFAKENLNNELKKLKGLFIYINNKKVKIQ